MRSRGNARCKCLRNALRSARCPIWLTIQVRGQVCIAIGSLWRVARCKCIAYSRDAFINLPRVVNVTRTVIGSQSGSCIRTARMDVNARRKYGLKLQNSAFYCITSSQWLHRLFQTSNKYRYEDSLCFTFLMGFNESRWENCKAACCGVRAEINLKCILLC